MNGMLHRQWRIGLTVTILCTLPVTRLSSEANAQSQAVPYQSAPYQSTQSTPYQNGTVQSSASQPRAATGYPATAAPRQQAGAATQGYPARNYQPQGYQPQANQPQRGRVSVAEARPAPSGKLLSEDLRRQAKIDPRHPLAPVINDLDQAYQVLSSIRNYECIFSKREVIDGKLTETENMYFKVRHQPFSIYLYCYGPAKPKGQEAIYIEGRNNGQVVAHSTGIRAIAGTVELDPMGARMMEGNRHPITNAGMKNLTVKLLDRYVREAKFGGSIVKEYEGVKVAGRTCKCVEITHPQPYKSFDFNVMRIYLDNEWKIPICMQAYGWPTQQGGAPQLIEEYTYSQLKFNQPLTDLDFDPNNPQYGYR